MSGEVAAFLSALSYALSYITLRQGQADVEPPDNGLFPVLLVSSVALVVSSIGEGLLTKVSIHFTHRELSGILFSIASGLIGTFLGRTALYAAISRIGATRGIVIKSFSPVITMVLAITVLHEQLDQPKFIGTLLLIIGISLLISERIWYPSRFTGRNIFTSGLFLGGIGAVMASFGHIFRKLSVSSSLSPLFAATVDVSSAMLVYLIWLVATGDLRRYISFYLHHRSLHLIAAGMLSAAGVLLFFHAVVDTPLSTVSMIHGTQPVLVALLSAILLHRLERLTWVTALCTIIVTLGLAVINLSK